MKHCMIIYDSPIELDLDKRNPRTDVMCFAYTKVGFNVWLNQSAVLANKKEDNGTLFLYDIKRERLIRLVANHWGGSHPEGAMVIEEDYDDVIEYLMSFKVFGIPLPFTILLKIAQDILDAFDNLVGSIIEQFASSKLSLTRESALTPLPRIPPPISVESLKKGESVLSYVTCMHFHTKHIIQINLTKGAPLQYRAGAIMCPENNIICCLGCKKLLDLSALRNDLEVQTGMETYFD